MTGLSGRVAPVAGQQGCGGRALLVTKNGRGVDVGHQPEQPK
jgi:hypothetical protein